MKERGQRERSLTGALLLAHPSLRDPNFRHSVVLLSAHSHEGALGVVLNQPVGKQLGELNDVFAAGGLSGVPVFRGGPVSPEQLILAAWKSSPGDPAFKLYFGIDPEKAVELGGEGMQIRAFLGYAGWTGGQLEGELKQETWVVRAVNGEELAAAESGRALWRGLLGEVDPELRLLADEPENPENN